MATTQPAALTRSLGVRLRPTALPMPNIRAVVGATLIVVAALLTLVAYQRANRPPSTYFVIARTTIPAGQTITAKDLAVAPMRLPDLLSANAFNSSSSLIGKSLAVTLRRGELIQSSYVSYGSDAKANRQVVLALDDAHALGGSVRANDTVDIVATTGTGASAQTKVLLSNIRILNVTSEKRSISGSSSFLITVSVPNQADEIAVVQAQDSGKITLVRIAG